MNSSTSHLRRALRSEQPSFVSIFINHISRKPITTHYHLAENRGLRILTQRTSQFWWEMERSLGNLILSIREDGRCSTEGLRQWEWAVWRYWMLEKGWLEWPKDMKREEKHSEDKVGILQQRDMLRLLERQLKAWAHMWSRCGVLRALQSVFSAFDFGQELRNQRPGINYPLEGRLHCMSPSLAL